MKCLTVVGTKAARYLCNVCCYSVPLMLPISLSLLEGGRGLGHHRGLWVLAAACCLLLALTKHLISNASPTSDFNHPAI